MDRNNINAEAGNFNVQATVQYGMIETNKRKSIAT